MSDTMPVVCLRCGSPAIAIFRFSHGCYCDLTEIQPLCMHHTFKSGPPPDGSMELVEDLTADGSFARYWSEAQV